MTTKPATLRSEAHDAVGAVIQRDAGLLVERWSRRAVEEQPQARRVHHDVLLDHLPTFLWDLGRALADSGEDASDRYVRPAIEHGDQRWEAGWSIAEVVRDYQLLRLVLVEHLEEALKRPLRSREVMALGVAIDDAIGASVAAFLRCESAELADRGAPPTVATGPVATDGFIGVLGVLGHELRNPLGPLGNALQVLRLAGNDEAKVEHARALMERQFRVMTRLVEDLLDVPRLVRGRMSIRRERIDLVNLVRQCVEDRRLDIEFAGIGVTAELPGQPVWTDGDPTRLSQVLGNLLHNAQKFTDRGGSVTVRLAVDAARPVALLSVRDTGIGIDREALPRVFETFMQADRSVERSRGGLGLGLALVRGIVELHGGAVRAASEGPGKGSEFVVELPLLEVPQARGAAAPESTQAGPGSRVLIVEDNRDSADALRLLLETVGHTVAVAHSGQEGLERARVFRPDVVICDIGLPGMSGVAVAAALRQEPALGKVQIFALSGYTSDGIPGDRDEGGFDVHLVKPVDPDHLIRLLNGKGAKS